MRAARETRTPFILCDSYDGGVYKGLPWETFAASQIIAKDGTVLARINQRKEAMLTYDLLLGASQQPAAEAYRPLVDR